MVQNRKVAIEFENQSSFEGLTVFQGAGIIVAVACTALVAVSNLAHSDEAELSMERANSRALQNSHTEKIAARSDEAASLGVKPAEATGPKSPVEFFAAQQIRQYSELLSALTERAEFANLSENKRAHVIAALEKLENELGNNRRALAQLKSGNGKSAFLRDDLRSSLFSLQEAAAHAQIVIESDENAEF